MAHVLVLPYPSQGHISPMLQLAKQLVAKGIRATLVTTCYLVSVIKAQVDSVSIASISDGYDQGGVASALNFETYLDSLKVVGSKSLKKLIEEQNQSNHPFTCMIYDPNVLWAVNVAKNLGLSRVIFSTQSCTVGAILHHVNNGIFNMPDLGASVSIFGITEMKRTDFPTLAMKGGLYPTFTDYNLKQFDFDDVDWILFNSFDALESEVIAILKKYIPARAIGPCIPLVPNINGFTNSYGISWYEPNISCLQWLDKKPVASVIYVSFSSFYPLQPTQTEELAQALKASGKFFLWVVRATEQKKLPQNFIKNNTEKGLVIPWSPQLEVLKNKAVGCFLTHCGWNSTLEAISFGVPMISMPVWTDQPTNAKCTEDVWGVSIRTKASKQGVVGRDEIERCIKDVMDGEKSQEIRSNVEKWKEAAEDAVSKGGSSDENLNEFVKYLNVMAETSRCGGEVKEA